MHTKLNIKRNFWKVAAILFLVFLTAFTTSTSTNLIRFGIKQQALIKDIRQP